MIPTKLLAIISRTRAVGIPKPVLKIEFKTLHGPLGDVEFDEALNTLETKRLIKSKPHALSDDTILTITEAGKKALS